MYPVIVAAVFAACLAPPSSSAQQGAASVPLGQGRPETPGVTRSQLKDDAKSLVVRVRCVPGAKEPPHMHPYDIILVPVTVGTVDLNVGGKSVSTCYFGDVQFIPRNTTHYLANTGTSRSSSLR
jgi:quercetin dioxygenase-like cupin family protein